MVRIFFWRLLLLGIALFPAPTMAGVEPPVVAATLDAIAVATGVRPIYRSIAVADNSVVVSGLRLDIPNPAEPNDVNSTSIDAIRLEGVESEGDGFRVALAVFSGARHRAAAFSMEVLQIDGLYAELGVDPPGSLGRASDETVETATLTLEDWLLQPNRLASAEALGAIVFGSRNLTVDRLSFSSQGSAPLIVTEIAVEEARKRSAGETWRYQANVDMTAPWLEALTGTVFSELGYARVPVRIEAETFRHSGRATGKAFVRANGAFNLVMDYALDNLAEGGAVAPAPAAILAASPDADLDGARLAFVDAGMARRAMALMAQQTGASPQALAAAFAQQAGSALRRASYVRIAIEAETALARFLTSFGHIAIAAPAGPLARFAATGGAPTPAALEAAGVTVSAK